MELHVEQIHVPFFSVAADETLREPFRMDCVIPDSFPDAGDVLETRGEFSLWRLDVYDGSAEMEGEINAGVCCLSESQTDTYGVPVIIPVKMRFRGGEITRGARPVLQCELLELHASLLNSRKLCVQCMMRCELTLYQPDDLCLTVGLGSGEETLYVRKQPVMIPVISDVTEQVFQVSESMQLGGAFPKDGRLLNHSSEAVVENVNISEQSVILSGKVVTDVSYLDAENGEIVSETLEAPFSQLMDPVTSDGVLLDAEVLLHLTSVDLQCRNDESAVDAAYHLVTQTVCHSAVSSEIVTDAYSVCGDLALTCSELALCESCGGESEDGAAANKQIRQIISAVLSDPSLNADTRPSVTLVRRDAEADLWEIAKEHQSSIDAIQKANPEADPPMRWMLIPRVG